MKKILALLLSGALLCGCLAGCVREGKQPYVPTGDALHRDDETQPTETVPVEKELTMMYYRDSSMNPLLAVDFTNRALFSLLYQGLFAVDRNYEVHPILCRNYTVSPDMRSYTFYLADNVTFSDGSKMTPVDVIQTMYAAMESPIYGGRLTHVRDLSMEEDGGVTFLLDTPYENFPLLLDIPILKDTELEERVPVGSGPYKLDSTYAGMRLLRRTDWWCDPALPITATSIPLKEAQSATQIRDSFEFSDVGLVCADPNTDAYADYRCDYELWDCENGDFLFLGCNIASPVFSNTRFRSALTYAIDRTAIAEAFYRGFARPATLPASPQSPYYNQALAARYEYDPDRFAYAVREANFPNDTKVVLLVNEDDSLRLRVAKRIAKMLESGGLPTEVKECDQEDFLLALKRGEYDLYLGQTRLSPNMDLTAFFHSTGNINFGGMSDAGLYALCLESLANRGNYYNLHARVLDDGRLCPILFQSYAVYATRGLASDLSPARDNIFYYDLGLTMADILLTES